MEKRIKIITLLLCSGLILMLCVKLLLWIVPFPELETFRQKPSSVRIYDRNGILLSVVPLEGGMRREYISLDNIPHTVRTIFLASEDKHFYFHSGIDIGAVLRALWINFSHKRIVSGASTITMQVARIVAPHGGGYHGKLIEMINALRIEAKCSKEEILELWFNSIYFGMRATGIATAAKTYFGKEVENLSPVEACILAVLPRRPGFYNPLTKPNNLITPVRKLMLHTRVCVEEYVEQMVKETLERMKGIHYPSMAHHFLRYIKPFLTPEEVVSGSDIYTSIDIHLNDIIECEFKRVFDQYEKKRLTQGAAVVFDNLTGEILAYCGSRDFFDKVYSGEIDGLHILNQPGSCLKPFLYALAFDSGFLPNTVLPDIPLDFGTDEVYTPANFNNRYHGPVRLRVALASSLNVPSVYLVTQIGVENFLHKLIECGFASIKETGRRAGSGIVLGNAEVSLFELTRAFSLFPGNGRILLTTWRRHQEEEGARGKRVFSSYAASMICHILSDNASRALGFSSGSQLNTDFPAMFKTGTSNQFNNIWACGATKRYTAGVWLGNFSGETVIGKTGSSIPAEIVILLLKTLDKHPESFSVPEHVKKAAICPLSGGMATDACPGRLFEYLPVHADITHCTYHTRENGEIQVNYPPLYSSWVKKYKENGNAVIKDRYDYSGNTAHEHTPYFRHPHDGALLFIDPSIPREHQALKIEVAHTKVNDLLRLSINGRFQQELTSPYIWYFPLEKGTWVLEIRDADSSDRIRLTVR
jgi:penicillin-binding protein 1C